MNFAPLWRPASGLIDGPAPACRQSCRPAAWPAAGRGLGRVCGLAGRGAEEIQVGAASAARRPVDGRRRRRRRLLPEVGARAEEAAARSKTAPSGARQSQPDERAAGRVLARIRPPKSQGDCPCAGRCSAARWRRARPPGRSLLEGGGGDSFKLSFRLSRPAICSPELSLCRLDLSGRLIYAHAQMSPEPSRVERRRSCSFPAPTELERPIWPLACCLERRPPSSRLEAGAAPPPSAGLIKELEAHYIYWRRLPSKRRPAR